MRRFTLIAALAVLSTGAFARADVEPSATNQAAQRHFESGVNFYKTGDYEAARIEFEAGYRLSKLPDFLVNLCQVADKQNRVQDAINYCEQYLRAEPNAAASAEVRTRLDNLHQRLADPAAARQPAPAVAQPTAPQVASQPSTEVTKQAARRPVPKGALALLVGGAVLLGVGAGTGGAALATSRELEAGPVFADSDVLKRRGEALNAVAITFYVVGGVAAVAGVAWLGAWSRRTVADINPL